MSLNEAFPKNMIGKTVKFDVQPYSRGEGKIVVCEPRRIKNVRMIDPTHGTMLVEYDVYDIEVAVEEGSEVGALWGGVPVASTVRETKGRVVSVTGVTKRQLQSATAYGETIVIARCG
ncbi:hypothetical protein vBCbaSRXM_58 [Citromicrobium phage vB_CbaS-RXM]|nr:hypothetical protein vBCbaSRXM_58 [Citromicrobium phage vB_CbaS-RXM]